MTADRAFPRFVDHQRHARTLIDAALASADPGRAVEAALPGEFGSADRVLLVAIGKASVAMARAACLGMRTPPARVLVTAVPDLAEKAHGLPPGAEVLPADHPLATERNVAAAERIERAVREAGEGWTVLVLVSGGGSAHLTLPDEGLTLDDLRSATDALLRAGAPIDELNTVRKHCERLKGGRLAALAAPARIVSLVLSDVVGDSPEAIASGPTAPDPSTYAEALGVLKRRRVLDTCPAVADHLKRGIAGALDETPKPGDPLFDRVRMRIVANNARAVGAVSGRASELGFDLVDQRADVQGEAAEVGRELVQAAVRQRDAAPCALVWGGETTVTVGKADGRGGRNQELALAAALEAEAHEGLCIGTFATDGVDGPTDAAGAIVTGATVRSVRAAGVDPSDALVRHDSHPCLDTAGALVRTGATGTNINDVAFALVYPTKTSVP